MFWLWSQLRLCHIDGQTNDYVIIAEFYIRSWFVLRTRRVWTWVSLRSENHEKDEFNSETQQKLHSKDFEKPTIHVLKILFIFFFIDIRLYLLLNANSLPWIFSSWIFRSVYLLLHIVHVCVCVRVLISCSFLMQDLTYSYGLIVIAQFIQRFKYASKRSSLCSHFDLHLLAGFCTASPPTSLSHLILFSFLFWTSGLHLTLKYCFILRPKRSTNRIICAIDDRSILIAMNKQNTYYNAELSFLPEWMNGYFESLIW